MNNGDFIVFDNLRQRTDVVGQYGEVKAKVQPFAAQNAKGILRSMDDHRDIGALAAEAANKALGLIKPA